MKHSIIKKRAQIISIWAFLFALMWGCANIVTPSGGPKDTTPPEVIRSNPENGQTNFQEENIELAFNEFFKLNSPAEEIYFSPPLPQKPEFSIQQQTLTIQLPENALRKNTTYTINFGKSIKDITEGNAAETLTYTFSTGPVIDSFQLSGIVKDAFTYKPEENVWVGLYQSFNDSVPDKKTPLYITRTGENGNYQFRHLRKGTYYLTALQDANRNLLYDLPNESFGFRLQPVNITDKDTARDNTVLLWEKTSFGISKTSHSFPTRGNIMIQYSQQVQKLENDVQTLSSLNSQVLRETILPNDSVLLWLNPLPDTLAELTTIVNDTLRDTITVDFSGKQPLANRLPRTGKNKSPQEGSRITQKVFEPYKLSFKTPIETINRDAITLMRDTATIIADTNYVIKKKNLRHLSIEHSWRDTTMYILSLADSAVRSIYGQYSRSSTDTFFTTKQSDFSDIILNFQNEEEGQNYFVELYKDDKQVYRKSNYVGKSSGKLVIQNLRPRSYQLRVIVDRNGNGKWDPGSFVKRQLPEKVIYYEGEIKVRPNWENSITINL